LGLNVHLILGRGSHCPGNSFGEYVPFVRYKRIESQAAIVVVLFYSVF
jgi:hypothetical protein